MKRARIEEFARTVEEWHRRLDETKWPRAMTRRSSRRELVGTIRELARRWREGSRAPARVAFFGPTGAGKSKMLNSLVGRVLSPSGFRRPFTRQPVYFLHQEWKLLAPTLAGRVEVHRDEIWKDLILIDSPDFDSIEVANREEAERIFLETDVFLFVVDGLKYADASTWEYLDRLRDSGKPFWLVLNKCESEDVPRDFRERLARRGDGMVPRATWSLPELAIDDETPIPSHLQALGEVKSALLGIAASDSQGRSLLHEVFRNDWKRLQRLTDQLLEAARRSRESLEALDVRLAGRFRDGMEQLRSGVEAQLERPVRQEVYQRWLERIERIDIFRYPRRLMLLPYEGLRAMVTRWRGERTGDSASKVDRRPVAADLTFQRLEAELLSLCEECRQDIDSEAPVKGLLTPARYRRLRPQHDALALRYEQNQLEFREWLANESRQVAAQLTTGTKLKFVLSQVIFNGALIGVQIGTGGALSLLEIGVDSMVSPLVAKAVGMAISSEEVRKFESRVKEEHNARLSAIFTEFEARFREFIDQAGEGLDLLTELLEEIAGSAQLGDALCEAYARGAVPRAESQPSPEDGEERVGSPERKTGVGETDE